MENIRFKTDTIAKQYLWLERTDSTNDVIKRLLVDGTTLEDENGYGRLIEGEPIEGLMVVTDQQTAGKGRSGHSWETPKGDSLAISVLLRPQISDDSIPMITLVAALAVASALRKSSGIETAIKWPNDVVVDGRKVCGILTELYADSNSKSLILGVGINVNQEKFSEELEDKAISIKMITGVEQDRESILQSFAECLEDYYKRFVAKDDMSELISEYSELLVNKDREVRVLDPSENINGIARGIDEKGQLLVETTDGKIHAIYAGEVSVRGIYGYV